MSVLIYCEGLLEPLELREPFQATMQNMSAAMEHKLNFFVGVNAQGQMDAVRIEKVIHIVSDEGQVA